MMQRMKRSVIAIVGAALFGLGSSFVAAADAPGPAVPEKAEVEQPAAPVVRRVYRHAPARVVHLQPRVVYTERVVVVPRVYPRRYVGAYGVYPRRYAAAYGFYPRRYVAGYGVRAYPRYVGGYSPYAARVHYRRHWY